MDLSHNWFSTLLHYFEQPRLNMVIVDLTTLASTLKYDDSFQDFLKVARLIMIMTGLKFISNSSPTYEMQIIAFHHVLTRIAIFFLSLYK